MSQAMLYMTGRTIEIAENGIGQGSHQHGKPWKEYLGYFLILENLEILCNFMENGGAILFITINKIVPGGCESALAKALPA